MCVWIGFTENIVPGSSPLNVTRSALEPISQNLRKISCFFMLFNMFWNTGPINSTLTSKRSFGALSDPNFYNLSTTRLALDFQMPLDMAYQDLKLYLKKDSTLISSVSSIFSMLYQNVTIKSSQLRLFF